MDAINKRGNVDQNLNFTEMNSSGHMHWLYTKFLLKYQYFMTQPKLLSEHCDFYAKDM